MPDKKRQTKTTVKTKHIEDEMLSVKLGRAEKLLNISRQLAEADTLDQMLETLVDIITSEVDATRCTIFLKDPQTDELYSRVAIGNFQREIRIMEKAGVAGWVFTTGESTIVEDAYKDERFNASIDEKIGFTTKNILCVPIRTVRGEIFGVAQALNKRDGKFGDEDLELLEAITTQASIALQTIQIVERTKKARQQELEFFDVVSDVISEIDLGAILNKVMSQATKMLNAERSTLFLNDGKTKELYSKVGEGLGAAQIRLPNHQGIAGAVFTSGKSVNIPHAYADLRFNPSFDKKTGFFTRSILCVPVVNKKGKTIGVTQVLNKRGGPFTDDDETRLRAFTTQVSIALENAQLFEEVQKRKIYSDRMLESMTNAVITLDEDGKIVTCNKKGEKVMNIDQRDILDHKAEDFFTGHNAWVMEKVKQVDDSQQTDETMEAELNFGTGTLSVNTTVIPLLSEEKEKLGTMIMIEDISNEKRMKSTMSKYMDPALAEKVLREGEDILGGVSVSATVLFTDIRGFTTLTEELGPQGTVKLLNDYFEIMVECITGEGGMLDKFIGDAMMAAFGIPIPHEDDEDRGVRSAITMIQELYKWNLTRTAHGKKPVDMGIGINTDYVVSGNIGSKKRLEYTMIGDGVNLASRLESACKKYSSRILISENTYKKLRGTYRIREIDKVVVKGKTQPVGVYEVLDYHTDDTFPNLMEVVNNFSSGIGHYRKRNWSKAVASFEKSKKLNPDDKLPDMYIERCAHFKENPPADDWSGEWVFTEK